MTVLNIGSGTRHFLDCVIDTVGNVTSFTWKTAEDIHMFPVTTETSTVEEVEMLVVRITLGRDLLYSDTGIYICTNAHDTPSASIKVAGGSYVT